MTFKEQIVASFIGSFFGFILAIVLYFIKNRITKNSNIKNYKKLLKREFAYDVALLKDWLDELETVLQRITAKDTEIYNYLKYSFFQRYFMQESFRLGIMYNLFSDEDISNLNNILLHCDVPIEQLVNTNIIKWKNGELEQKEALRFFQFQKEKLKEHKVHLEKLMKKF